MITKISILPKSVAKSVEEKGNYISISDGIGSVSFKIIHSKLSDGKSLTLKVMNSNDALGTVPKVISTVKVTESSLSPLSDVCQVDIKPSARAGEYYSVACVHDNETAIILTAEISYNERYSE